MVARPKKRRTWGHMRLICPNCDAQYEVGEGVIPADGRDVQCSNCGHTWFQYPEGYDDRPVEELEDDRALTAQVQNHHPEDALEEDDFEKAYSTEKIFNNSEAQEKVNNIEEKIDEITIKEQEIASLENDLLGSLSDKKKSKIQSKEKIIIDVGSGVAVEKDQNSAINWLESRLKELEIALQNVSSQRKQVADNLEIGKQQMQNIMQKSQMPKK